MKRRTLLLTLALLWLASPAFPQEGGLAIRAAAVHTLVEGAEPIAGGVVIVRDGRIVAVGGADTPIPDGVEVIDMPEGHVYPGMFDISTRVGLTEIGQVPVTSDFRELGDNNPHLQAATAVHPASEIIPVTRSNGITHVVAAPAGNGIAGQGSLIHLDGWTVEEMLVDPSVYMVVTWPNLQTRGFDRSTFTVFDRSFREAKEEYDSSIADLEALLEDARRYVAAGVGDDPMRRDLKLEALTRVTSGELPLMVSVSDARGIRDAIAFAERNGVRIIVAGGDEAHEVADELAAAGVPVVLGPTQSMPTASDAPYDEAYARPGMLHAAGVQMAISTFNASSVRVLPYEAGMAVRYGLPREAALAAVTRVPAQILGVDDELGTIETGKLANLMIVDGDPLEIDTNVLGLVIDGAPVDPKGNKHDRLFERYRSRPQRGDTR